MGLTTKIEDAVIWPILRAHQRVYVRTGGRVGHRILGVPSLLLKSTGRRTGAPRTNALIYARDGDEYVVVASNGGLPKHPAWVHNVAANPDVRIQIGTREMPARARVLEPSDPDYARLWRLVNERNGNRYDRYQVKTERPIRLVALRPA